MVDAERRKKNENIMVKEGKGKYPQCLKTIPYSFCPSNIPDDPKNVPHECKTCPEFINSKFYYEVYMSHEKRIEMIKKRGLPLVIRTENT
ncbi:MAG: hypothetical protein QW051_02590 [Candidatus Aenigmatarchaeota archaeon]